MAVTAFIEDSDVIKKILKHLGLWNIKRKPRPTANVYLPWRARPSMWFLHTTSSRDPVLMIISLTRFTLPPASRGIKKNLQTG
jgi:hypothetical protein